ncbi:exodeoxyribonuclease V subunit gamma [Arenimonas composti]|nr:exodeoxyribonuclease V subunit gamma [Arenimonas composti]
MTTPPVPGRLIVLRASRLEALLAPLDELLRSQAPASPLQPQTVVAAHPGMRQWLAGALARHRGREDIVANLDIVLPSTFLDGLAREVLGTEATSHQAWRRETLRWHLHALLAEPGDPVLEAALADDHDGLRRFQLADRLARIHGQYMAYRPDWLRAWAAGRSAFAEEGFHPGLWRRLYRRLRPHPHRGEQLEALRRKLEQGAPPALPDDPLHVFGLSHLAPAELEVFAALARWRPVVFHVPDPCREYWMGLRGERERLRQLAEAPYSEESEALLLEQDHPLLAAWGRLGQHFLLQLQELPIDLDLRNHHDQRDDAPKHLLDRLQESIRRLEPALAADDPRAPAERRADPSLRVHRCHTRLRELEVLRDALLQARVDDPTIEPADIVVMAPDIRAYVPLLPVVFGPAGDPAQPLPWHLADVAVADTSPLLAAFRRVLALPVSRATAPELVDLLAQPDVARRLGLDEDAIATLARRLGDARAAWALDPGFRAAFGVPAREEHTLAWAMDRLVSAFVHGDEDAVTVHALADGSEIASVPAVAAGGAPGLAALDHLLQQLAAMRADAAAALRAKDWAARLQERLDALIAPDPADDGSRTAMETLRGILHALAAEPEDAGENPPLSYAVVRRWIEEKLDALSARQRFLAGGMTVCGMVPQRAIPFRIVAVLGLDEGEFPRNDVDAGLDPIRRPGLRRLGDRDTRSDDRYLFLETVMSARDRLHLSWRGRDAKDDSLRNPAAPLVELMAALPPPPKPAAGGVTPPPDWRVDHPLQPFDARYYAEGGDPRLYTFAAGWSGVGKGGAAPEAAGAGAGAGADVAAPPAHDGDAPVHLQLDELRQRFRDPAKARLARDLRARLDGLEEEALAEDEPLEETLAPLDRAARGLLLAALRDPARRIDPSPPRHLVRGGVLPAGRLGERAWAGEVERAQILLAAIEERPETTSLFSPVLADEFADAPLRRDFGRYRIDGRPSGVHERDGIAWVFAAFPHVDREHDLGFGERLPLFLVWALLRLAPENAERRVRLCLLLKHSARARGERYPWQRAIAEWDEAWVHADADLRKLLSGALEQHVSTLLEHAVAPPPTWFPRTASAVVTGRDAEEAWQQERAYTPGYARLLGRGLGFAEGSGEEAALRLRARRLAEAILWPLTAEEEGA